jgi:hypothetical protein
MTGLSPSETKILVAKSFAFMAFEERRRDLLRDSIFDEIQYCQEISSSCNVIRAKDNNEKLVDYLFWFSSTLLTSLRSKLPQLATELTEFESTLNAYISTPNLDSTFAGFLTEIRASVPDYAALGTIPSISLSYGIESGLIPAMGGRTNQIRLDMRDITLVFDLNNFDPMSLFSVPWVLSHEFWCHCLADLGAQQKGGCDPTAAFEEGWMDCVQDTIIRVEIQNIYGNANLVRLIDYWEKYIVQRKGKLSGNAMWGFEVAEHFMELLVQKLNDLNPISLFCQLSLDLNALQLDQDVKGSFVDEVARRLKITAPLFGGKALEAVVVEQRRILAENLRLAIVGGKCDVMYLFKLLKIKT